VLVDLDDERHVAWLLCRHLKGEKQKQIGRQLGYVNGAKLCVLFDKFTRRHCPEAPLRINIASVPAYDTLLQYGNARLAWFEKACRRFYAMKAKHV
jgi:hypothetical protein